MIRTCFIAASTRVYEEAKGLKIHYEQEKELKKEAEQYAHKVKNRLLIAVS